MENQKTRMVLKPRIRTVLLSSIFVLCGLLPFFAGFLLSVNYYPKAILLSITLMLLGSLNMGVGIVLSMIYEAKERHIEDLLRYLEKWGDGEEKKA